MLITEVVIYLSSSSEAQYDGSEHGNEVTGNEVSGNEGSSYPKHPTSRNQGYGDEGSSQPIKPPMFGRERPIVTKGIATRFKEYDVTAQLVKWYGYKDFDEKLKSHGMSLKKNSRKSQSTKGHPTIDVVSVCLVYAKSY